MECCGCCYPLREGRLLNDDSDEETDIHIYFLDDAGTSVMRA